MSAKAKIGVLGASGYTGAELLRLLIGHPRVAIRLLTADRRAGEEMRAVFPQFAPHALPRLVSIAVSPAQTSVPAGLTQQLTATGVFADRSKADITAELDWSSSAAGVATVLDGIVDEIGDGVEQEVAISGHQRQRCSRCAEMRAFLLRRCIEELDDLARDLGKVDRTESRGAIVRLDLRDSRQ